MKNIQRSLEPPASRLGAAMREQLLEAAGEVFAEKGLHGATSREICLRAGVNLAAVNYHFGGFEALYMATLLEADRRTNWISPLDPAHFDDLPARQRLKSVLRHLSERLIGAPDDAWEMRLINREMVIPTFAQADFIAIAIQPRRQFLKKIIADMLDLPVDDAAVARCALTAMAPCLMLSIVNRATLETFMPDLKNGQSGAEELVNHIERSVLAGVDAIKRSLKNS